MAGGLSSSRLASEMAHRKLNHWMDLRLSSAAGVIFALRVPDAYCAIRAALTDHSEPCAEGMDCDATSTFIRNRCSRCFQKVNDLS